MRARRHVKNRCAQPSSYVCVLPSRRASWAGIGSRRATTFTSANAASTHTPRCAQHNAMRTRCHALTFKFMYEAW